MKPLLAGNGPQWYRRWRKRRGYRWGVVGHRDVCTFEAACDRSGADEWESVRVFGWIKEK